MASLGKAVSGGEQPSCELLIIISDVMVRTPLCLCRVQVLISAAVTSSNATTVHPSAWEESTGLLSSLIPPTPGSAASLNNPQAFNASRGDLKLGSAPLSEELRTETERVLREQAVLDRDMAAQYDLHYGRPPAALGLIAPTEADLLPHPPTFNTLDVRREVEKVRDARKRIRLEPSVLGSAPSSANAKGRALPSVCAYTLHDVPEGLVFDTVEVFALLLSSTATVRRVRHSRLTPHSWRLGLPRAIYGCGT
jgi:hypothetical protein